jgi:hypothetical protein
MIRTLLRRIGRYEHFLLILAIIIGASLRLYRLDEVPLGYSVDEAAIVYDGWNIASVGMDLHLNEKPLIFRSLGDYKSPLMIYLVSIVYKLIDFDLGVGRLISATVKPLYLWWQKNRLNLCNQKH